MNPNGSGSRPHRVDLRELTGPVRDQGARPTCLPFATSAAHELKLSSQHLAPEALYRFAQQYDGVLCDGSTVCGVTTAIEICGQCLEIDWPYGATEALNPQANYFRATCAHGEVSLLDFTLSSVAAGTCPVIALRITNAWHHVGNDGQINSADIDNQIVGNHAVAAVGYDEEVRQVLVRNSWGDDWGLAGYGLLPFEVFNARVISVFALA